MEQKDQAGEGSTLDEIAQGLNLLLPVLDHYTKQPRDKMALEFAAVLLRCAMERTPQGGQIDLLDLAHVAVQMADALTQQLAADKPTPPSLAS